jgi:hypothetical protein
MRLGEICWSQVVILKFMPKNHGPLGQRNKTFLLFEYGRWGKWEPLIDGRLPISHDTRYRYYTRGQEADFGEEKRRRLRKLHREYEA